MQDIYIDGTLIEADDIGFLSEEHSVPYDIVAEIVEKYRNSQDINTAAYSGVLKTRTEQFISLLSLHPTLENETTELIVCENYESNVIKEKEDQVTSLIRIVTDPISNFFVIREGGQATLKANNPPTIKEAYEVIDRIFVARDLTNKIDDYSTWLLGSITSELENYFGAEFDVSQVGEISDKAYNTIVTAVGVFKEYNGRQYKLSFSHHKEAYYAKISKEDKNIILQKAEDLGLSAKHVRKLASLCKKLGSEILIDIDTKEKAEDIIAACKENTLDYVVLDEENLWTRTKTMNKPSGKIVIDLKNNKIEIEGKTMDLKYRNTLTT